MKTNDITGRWFSGFNFKAATAQEFTDLKQREYETLFTPDDFQNEKKSIREFFDDTKRVFVSRFSSHAEALKKHALLQVEIEGGEEFERARIRRILEIAAKKIPHSHAKLIKKIKLERITNQKAILNHKNLTKSFKKTQTNK